MLLYTYKWSRYWLSISYTIYYVMQSTNEYQCSELQQCFVVNAHHRDLRTVRTWMFLTPHFRIESMFRPNRVVSTIALVIHCNDVHTYIITYSDNYISSTGDKNTKNIFKKVKQMVTTMYSVYTHTDWVTKDRLRMML